MVAYKRLPSPTRERLPIRSERTQNPSSRPVLCAGKRSFAKGYRVPILFTEDAKRRGMIRKLHVTGAQYFWLRRVLGELATATQLNGKFNCTHKGYAVLLVEVDELWDGVKDNLSQDLLAAEAVQVAVKAQRSPLDLCREAVR